MAYTGDYPLYVTQGQYNVDPTVDPAKQSPITDGRSAELEVLTQTEVYLLRVPAR